MGHALYDLTRHNAWATTQIIDFCRELDDTALDLTTPGTYGTIRETLRHFLDSETSYLSRLSGLQAGDLWYKSIMPNLDGMAERAAALANTWEQFLAGEVDTEGLGEAKGDEGEIFAVRKGVFLAQALHHANEHRAHICTILGAHGYEPPDVSAWGYAQATGRSTLKTDAS